WLNPVFSGFILVELAALAVPRWRPLRDEGMAGRRRLHRAAVWLSVALTLTQSFMLSRALNARAPYGSSIADEPGAAFVLVATLSFTCGTLLLLALASLIDAAGVGGGISLLVALPLGYSLVTSVGLLDAGVERGDLAGGDMAW